jgi:hypothetical protein
MYLILSQPTQHAKRGSNALEHFQLGSFYVKMYFYVLQIKLVEHAMEIFLIAASE